MDTKKDQSILDRREALKMLGIDSTAGIMGMLGSASPVRASEKEAAKYPIGTKSNWQVRKADGTLIRP